MSSLINQNHKTCILLAVWGERFILDFLQFSLPSLLAPGNIPALANTYQTRFVFLTRSFDIAIFEDHPAFQKLKTFCEVEFLPINDLIMVGNYSTTLTFAYDRAIRQTGEEMLNTYFLFLTSDYIMADGSLEGLMRYIQKGYSGICAGNFQVLQEEMEKFLLDKIDPETQVLQIKPRELLKESFQHLHPITVASLYENSKIHNYYANRFFLRQDPQTMAGRFYLLHMLCIKPEILDYQIGASCDYSFISEMCPSGNTAIIDDSDDYLVVEIQSKEHELEYIHWGSYDLRRMVNALAQWTTEHHRNNSKKTIYFHTEDVNSNKKTTIEQKLNQFIDKITTDLKKFKPKSFRNHPYWLGAVQAFDQHKSIIKDSKEYDYFNLSPLNHASKYRKLFYNCFGYPPNVYPWHFRWKEYNLVMDLLRQQVSRKCDKTIVIYDSYQLNFMRYSSWLKNTLKIPHHYYGHNLTYLKNELRDLQLKEFELCVLFVRVDDLSKIMKLLLEIKKILVPDSKVLLLIPNQRNFFPNFVYDFPKEFAFKITTLISSPYRIENITTVHDNFSLFGSMAINIINRRFSHSRKLKFFYYLLVGLPGSLLCFFRNILTKASNRKKGHCTNILVSLIPDENRIDSTI